MERHGGDLEAKPDDHEAHAGQQDAGVDDCVGGEENDYFEVLRRTGRTVNEGYPVDEYRGGERTEDEVLEACLARRGPSPVVSAHGVQGDRHYFQAEEQADQAGRVGHEHRPGRAGHHENVGLRAVQVLPGQVAVRDERPQESGGTEQDREKGRKTVVVELAAHGERVG
jgi:hypothetical protein